MLVLYPYIHSVLCTFVAYLEDVKHQGKVKWRGMVNAEFLVATAVKVMKLKNWEDDMGGIVGILNHK